nr:YbaK/EbsC family protein [Haloarcula sp. 1CSR25-25]
MSIRSTDSRNKTRQTRIFSACFRDYGAAAASMADPTDIRSVVGWSIGGVPPICHETALPTTVDPTLAEYDVVHAAAGTPSAVFAVGPDRLADLADAEVVDLTA